MKLRHRKAGQVTATASFPDNIYRPAGRLPPWGSGKEAKICIGPDTCDKGIRMNSIEAYVLYGARLEDILMRWLSVCSRDAGVMHIKVTKYLISYSGVPKED